MDSVAEHYLSKLLKSAEGFWERHGRRLDEKATLSLIGKQGSVYRQVRDIQRLRAIHAELSLAQRAGGLTIEWEDHHEQTITRLRAVNADALAQLLDQIPAWSKLESASMLLADLEKRLPRVAAIRELWSRGKSCFGLRPEEAYKLTEAARLLDYLRSRDGEDVPVRRASAALFSDSKYIETHLLSALNALSAQDLSAPRRADEDLFPEFGLVRFPSAMLIASSGCSIKLASGTVLEGVAPYIGLDPISVAGFSSPPSVLLTIENLTVFHEASRAENGSSWAVIYTNGMPSRRFMSAYLRMVSDTRETTRLLHWGDTDLGGLRIAARIADSLKPMNRALGLLQMCGHNLELAGRKALSDAECRSIRQICDAFGWSDVADEVDASRRAIEQEEQTLYPTPL